MLIKSKISHDREILYGLAKGPWADFWANRQEERRRSFSQHSQNPTFCTSSNKHITTKNSSQPNSVMRIP